MFAANPIYVEYESLLRQLNQLTAEGNDESAEADAIRDRMETLHWKLSQAERERLRGLSADLYMLQGDEVYEQLPDDITQDSLKDRMKNAQANGNFEELLSLLRKGPVFLSRDQVAFYRFYSYEGLGHVDTSIDFLEYASYIAPGNKEYKELLLNAFTQKGEIHKATVLAEELISRSDTPRHVLINSAYVLYQSTRLVAESERKAIYVRAAEVLESALQNVQVSAFLSNDMIADAFVILGYCYEETDNITSASNAFDNALRFNPNDSSALVARGLLREQSDLIGAVNDFEAAVRNNAIEVSPYLHLASHYLTQGDYQRGIQMCMKVRKLSRNPRILTLVSEWMASVYYSQGAPMDIIRLLLEEALSYDPLNERIRFNLDQIASHTESASNRTYSPLLVENFSVASNNPERHRLPVMERVA